MSRTAAILRSSRLAGTFGLRMKARPPGGNPAAQALAAISRGGKGEEGGGEEEEWREGEGERRGRERQLLQQAFRNNELQPQST